MDEALKNFLLYSHGEAGSNLIREVGITFYFLLRGKWAGRKMPLRAGNLIVREPALFFALFPTDLGRLSAYRAFLYTTHTGERKWETA